MDFNCNETNFQSNNLEASPCAKSHNPRLFNLLIFESSNNITSVGDRVNIGFDLKFHLKLSKKSEISVLTSAL
jgi:hypothetical protein